MRTMIRAGFVDKLGLDHFCAHLDTALATAQRIMAKEQASV